MVRFVADDEGTCIGERERERRGRHRPRLHRRRERGSIGWCASWQTMRAHALVSSGEREKREGVKRRERERERGREERESESKRESETCSTGWCALWQTMKAHALVCVRENETRTDRGTQRERALNGALHW